MASGPPEDLRAQIRFMIQLDRDLAAEGVLVGADGLASPGEAGIVRAGTDGAPAISDGRSAESQELLAGDWIVEVEDPDAAYAIATRVAAVPGPGGAPLNLRVEARQVVSGPPLVD